MTCLTESCNFCAKFLPLNSCLSFLNPDSQEKWCCACYSDAVTRVMICWQGCVSIRVLYQKDLCIRHQGKAINKNISANLVSLLLMYLSTCLLSSILILKEVSDLYLLVIIWSEFVNVYNSIFFSASI